MTAVDRDGGARISHVENKCEFVARGEVGESSVSRTDDRGRGRNGFTPMIQGGEKNDFIGRLGLEAKEKSRRERFDVSDSEEVFGHYDFFARRDSNSIEFRIVDLLELPECSRIS